MEKGVRGWCNGKVIDAFVVGLQRTMTKERRCKSQSYLCGGEWYEDEVLEGQMCDMNLWTSP